MTTSPLSPRLEPAGVDAPALVWRDAKVSYATLLQEARAVRQELDQAGVKPGDVVSLEGDFTPRTIASLLALIELEAIVVPLADDLKNRRALCAAAQVECRALVDEESFHVLPTKLAAAHPTYDVLRQARHPGVVLFSSGSDGPPKAAVHDFVRLCERYKRPGRRSTICAFLAFDHIGGLNTLLYTLVNGGCLAVPSSRLPDDVCRLIESHLVEVLPTTPTFLNTLLLSDALHRFDLRSLRLITYGTEVMPRATLNRLRTALPDVGVLQTYGLSETGILATRTPDPDSEWFSFAREGVETRVVDGVLHVRTATTMLGYLDGPSPRMLPDGWFDTGDLVEFNGALVRVIGRSGDLVNIGGLKAHPAEIEAVVLELLGVIDARVIGESNAITGQHLRLDVVLATDESVSAFRQRLDMHLAGRLEPYKMPQRIVISDRKLHGRRHKKVRGVASEVQAK